MWVSVRMGMVTSKDIIDTCNNNMLRGMTTTDMLSVNLESSKRRKNVLRANRNKKIEWDLCDFFDNFVVIYWIATEKYITPKNLLFYKKRNCSSVSFIL